MSNSSANEPRSALDRAGVVLRSGRTVLAPIRTVAFWTAVALPFLYLPLLATGLEETTTTAAFVTLLAANAVALLVGHSHRRA